LPVVPNTEHFTGQVLGFQGNNQFIPASRIILEFVNNDIAEFSGVPFRSRIFHGFVDHVAEIDLMP
jgi:hypothetical protein